MPPHLDRCETFYKQGGVSLLAWCVCTYMNTTISRCYGTKVWGFFYRENTTKSAAGTKTVDMCCLASEAKTWLVNMDSVVSYFYVLLLFDISPPLSFLHSEFYKHHCFCAWCPTSGNLSSSAQKSMRRSVSSLHQVNHCTHFVVVMLLRCTSKWKGLEMWLVPCLSES